MSRKYVVAYVTNLASNITPACVIVSQFAKRVIFVSFICVQVYVAFIGLMNRKGSYNTHGRSFEV